MLFIGMKQALDEGRSIFSCYKMFKHKANCKRFYMYLACTTQYFKSAAITSYKCS